MTLENAMIERSSCLLQVESKRVFNKLCGMDLPCLLPSEIRNSTVKTTEKDSISKLLTQRLLVAAGLYRRNRNAGLLQHDDPCGRSMPRFHGAAVRHE